MNNTLDIIKLKIKFKIKFKFSWKEDKDKKKKKQIIELGNPFYIKKISKLYKHININNYVLKTAEGAEVTFNNSENPSSN